MKQHFFSLALISTILSSCMTQTPAPVDYGNSSTAGNSKYSSSGGDDIVEKPIVRETTNWGDKTVETTTTNPNNVDDTAATESVTPNPIAPEPAPAPPPRTKTISHEVIEGETVDSLAQQYDVDKNAIIKVNKLKAPYTLDELQIIKIPPQTPAAPPVTDAMADESPVGDAVAPDDLEKAPPAATPPVAASGLPVAGKIISKFGDTQSGSKNNGVNIESPLGTNIISLRAGKAVYSGTDPKFGNLIIIKSNDSEIFMAYSHMSDLMIKQGEIVSKGQTIGHVGQTGEVTSPQLHFAVRQGRTPIDPEKYLMGQ